MNLKRAHLILALVATVLCSFIIPLLSAFSSYNRSFAAVDDKIAQVRLDTAQAYVKKEDFQMISQKLDRISEELSEIKGYVRAQNHQSFKSASR